MQCCTHLRRFLSGAIVVAVFGGLLIGWALSNRAQNAATGTEGNQGADEARFYPWPMFGGTNSRNFVNLREKNMPIKWDIEPKEKDPQILWSADLGSKSYGGPVVADGKIFIGTNNEKPRDPKIRGDKGIIMCFEEKTGKFLWQRVHDKLPAGQVMDWPREGICSSPVVEGKRIYYVSNRCEVVCSDTDGKDIWSLDMIKTLGVFPHNLAVCSPLILGDLLFVVTANGVDEGHINLPAPAAPSFLAINKKDGKVKWQNNDPSKNLLNLPKDTKEDKAKAFIKQLVDKGELLMHGQWSNPVYANVNGAPQIIFPGGDGWMRAFEPDTGKLIWKFDCNPKAAFYKLGAQCTRNDFVSTPVIYDNKLYIGVGQDPEHKEGIGHLWCIDITKKGDISPVGDNFDPKAAVNKNSGLVWHYGEPSDPKEKIGRNYVFGRTLSTAAVHNDLLYIGELAGVFHCLDAKTGKQLWVDDLNTPIWSSPFVVDGKVYIGTDSDELHVYEVGRQKKKLAVNDMGGAVRATPVAANGVLYVMTEKKIYAIKAVK